MKLRYKVSEKDYIALLAGLIRKKDAAPWRRVMFFVLTAGQMAVVAWLCIFRLAPGQRLFYIVWSLLLAGFTLLRRFTAPARAKGTLYRLKEGGQLPADFWEEHRLSEEEEGLVLCYGGVRTVCPRGSFSGFYEEDGLLYLKAGDGIFDIIPLDTFSGPEKKERFLSALRAFQEKQAEALLQAGRDGGPETASSGNGADGAPAELSFTLTGDAFVRLQAAAFRTVYLRYQVTERISLFKIAASVFLLIVTAMNFSPGTAALGAALILMLNRNHLLVLTPLLLTRVRSELGAFAEGGEYRLTAEPGGMRISLGREQAFLPWSRVDASEDFKGGHLYSWGSLPAAVIPAGVLSGQKGRDFLEKAEALRKAAKYGRSI